MELSLEALENYARAFVQKLPDTCGDKAYVVGLTGDLGSGKTTFVQNVARVLGVSQPVTSPTYVIVQSYKIAHPPFARLVHIDAYRLAGEVGDTIGFSEYLNDPHTLVLVEWPEHLPVGAQFPPHADVLSFKTIDENTRSIT